MLLVLFVSFLSVILIVVKYYYSFWFRNGFPSITPSFTFGCLGPVAVGTKSMGELMRGLHLNSKERFLGIYFFWRPVLLIRDPDLVKRVLITDFDHFQNRGVHYDEVSYWNGEFNVTLWVKLWFTGSWPSGIKPLRNGWSRMEEFTGQTLPDVLFWKDQEHVPCDRKKLPAIGGFPGH